ncbi:hypothetical protein ACE6H2_021364 [Prunus campanulata]
MQAIVFGHDPTRNLRIKDDGFHPDVATYGSLANGIALAGKPGEALLLWIWNEVKARCRVKMGGESSDPPMPKPDEG